MCHRAWGPLILSLHFPTRLKQWVFNYYFYCFLYLSTLIDVFKNSNSFNTLVWTSKIVPPFCWYENWVLQRSNLIYSISLIRATDQDAEAMKNLTSLPPALSVDNMCVLVDGQPIWPECLPGYWKKVLYDCGSLSRLHNIFYPILTRWCHFSEQCFVVYERVISPTF